MASVRSVVLDYVRRCGFTVAAGATIALANKKPLRVSVALSNGCEAQIALCNLLGRPHATAMHLFEKGTYKGLVWPREGYNLAAVESRFRSPSGASPRLPAPVSVTRALPAPTSPEVEAPEIEILPPVPRALRALPAASACLR